MNKSFKRSSILVFGLGVFVGYAASLVIDRTSSQDNVDEKRSSFNAVKDEDAVELRREIERVQARNADLSFQVEKLKEVVADYRSAEEEKAELLREEEEALQKDKMRVIKRSLGMYEKFLSLSPQQSYMIGEWEWEVAKYWMDFHAGKHSPGDPIPSIEDRIRGILSPDQLGDYEAFLDERSHNNAELVASAQLQQYPASLGLSEEQKDLIYQNLYMMFHTKYSNEFNEQFEVYRNEGVFDRNAATFIIAAEGALNEEQLDALKKSFLDAETARR